jgi:hypothetical protein
MEDQTLRTAKAIRQYLLSNYSLKKASFLRRNAVPEWSLNEIVQALYSTTASSSDQKTERMSLVKNALDHLIHSRYVLGKKHKRNIGDNKYYLRPTEEPPDLMNSNNTYAADFLGITLAAFLESVREYSDSYLEETSRDEKKQSSVISGVNQAIKLPKKNKSINEETSEESNPPLEALNIPPKYSVTPPSPSPPPPAPPSHSPNMLPENIVSSALNANFAADTDNKETENEDNILEEKKEPPVFPLGVNMQPTNETILPPPTIKTTGTEQYAEEERLPLETDFPVDLLLNNNKSDQEMAMATTATTATTETNVIQQEANLFLFSAQKVFRNCLDKYVLIEFAGKMLKSELQSKFAEEMIKGNVIQDLRSNSDDEIAQLLEPVFIEVYKGFKQNGFIDDGHEGNVWLMNYP